MSYKELMAKNLIQHKTAILFTELALGEKYEDEVKRLKAGMDHCKACPQDPSDE